MTTSSKQRDTLLSISPLADLVPGKQRDGINEDGTVDIWGWCRPWCDIKDEITGRDSGTPVSEHGILCEYVVTFIDGRTPDGHETFVRLDLVAAYTHGVYKHEEEKHVSRDSFLRFTTFDSDDQDGDPLSEFFFQTGDARKLSRVLELAADRLDNFK